MSCLIIRPSHVSAPLMPLNIGRSASESCLCAFERIWRKDSAGNGLEQANSSSVRQVSNQCPGTGASSAYYSVVFRGTMPPQWLRNLATQGITAGVTKLRTRQSLKFNESAASRRICSLQRSVEENVKCRCQGCVTSSCWYDCLCKRVCDLKPHVLSGWRRGLRFKWGRPGNKHIINHHSRHQISSSWVVPDRFYCVFEYFVAPDMFIKLESMNLRRVWTLKHNVPSLFWIQWMLAGISEWSHVPTRD